MAYTIKFLDRAERELAGLSRDNLIRVARAINKLSEDPRPAGCKPLKGLVNYYRIRIGDYRVIYSVEKNQLIVVVVRIAHRGQLYKKLKRLRH